MNKLWAYGKISWENCGTWGLLCDKSINEMDVIWYVVGISWEYDGNGKRLGRRMGR